MINYLITTLVSCHVFNNLPHKSNFNIDEEPVQFWYLVFWRHKAPFHFCQIRYLFVKEVNYLITGQEPAWISGQGQAFLWGRESMKKEKTIP